jgi:hypothetical protein
MLHEGVRALHKGLHCLLAFRRHDVALGPGIFITQMVAET